MLRWRLILGAVFIGALVALCWFDHRAALRGSYLMPLALMVSLLCASELVAMFRKRGHQPLAWVVYGGTAITVVAACVPEVLFTSWRASMSVGQLGWLAIGLAAAWMLAVIGELRRFDSPGRSTTDLAVSCFAILYVGMLTGFLVQLRLLRIRGDGADWGLFALATFIATVKMSDTGQYTAGRLWGRHKLAPRVSPGKTWEGAAGGLVIAAATSAALVFLRPDIEALKASEHWPEIRMSLLSRAAICGVLLAIAGIIGDLAESMLKRDAGVKDSSTWMQGFGGVLDLMDSLLGAAPVAYMLWAFGVYGP
jgi:phosphatidate cytidylyltransferase